MTTHDDDAPEWSAAVFARAEIKRGGEVVRPASGTLTKPYESMIERAARAAFESYAEKAYPDGPEGDYEEVWEMGREGFIDAARAVLMAVREPGALSSWAGSVQYERAKAEGYDASEAVKIIHTAMIDAILNETPE